MKCSECGSDSPSGSARCTHCGRLPDPAETGSAALSETSSASLIAGERAKSLLASANLTSSRVRVDLELSGSQGTPEPGKAGSIAGVETRAQPPWQEQLSERVDDYRRRRSRLKGVTERSSNLTLDFDLHERGKPGSDSAGSGPPENPGFPRETTPPPEAPQPTVGSSAKARNEPTAKRLPFAEEIVLGRRANVAAPLEVVLGGSSALSDSKRAGPGRLQIELAPLGRRFLAGVVDSIVLLSAGGIFALVFWLVGGHASPNLPNDLAVGLIAAFVFLTYFGMFTLLTSSTPGLSLMALEVRNLEGNYPTRQEAFWRAFGYLVSTSAMMLGFLWALFDSEGLTWHDRMSGTFVSVISN